MGDNGAVTDTDIDVARRAPGPSTTTPVGVPLWTGVLMGVLAAAAGLVAGELLGGLFSADASPVTEVGNRIVDIVPAPLREWAISTFGTNDKAVLLGGVVVGLLVVASIAGTMASRGRRGAAVAVVGVVTVLAALASLGRGGAGPVALFSTLIGGLVTLSVLLWLASLVGGDRSPATRDSGVGQGGVDPGSSAERPVGEPSRRRFFGAAAAVAGVTAAGGVMAVWLRSNAAVAAERLGVTLPKALVPLAAPPSGVSVGLEGVSPFFTSNDDFYRIDTAFSVPRVSVADWKLRIHGMVDREITLDFETLLDRPQIEVDATIACVSNEVGGDLIGTARWLGCRLDDLLDDAGVQPSADQIVGRSIDGFTAGFPTSVLDGRDAIVAIGMNGEPLPTRHGYPARLIVPGLYGYVSATKWLSEIELTTFADFEGYWIPRGWDRLSPVVTSSRIDTPRANTDLDAGAPVDVGGVAWAMTRGIETVELRVDGGPWEQATLGEEYAGTTWRQWRHRVVLEGGDHQLAVRATDTDGNVQSADRRPPGPNASSGLHTITLTAN